MKKSLVYRVLILSFTILIGFSAYSQKRKVLNLPSYDQAPYHFGFILAANNMLFTIKPVDNLQNIKWSGEQSPDIFADSLYVYNVTSEGTPGFSIGILGNLRISKHFDLRFVPTLSFGERLINYGILSYKDGESTYIEVQKSITSTLVEFPLFIKYRSNRLNNFAAYVTGGAKYTLDLASQKKAEKNLNDVSVKIQKHDVLAEIGVGVDFYTNFFKFGTEIRMGYGLFNLIKKEGNLYTDSIDHLNSKIFLLSFTFE
ncbi:MAG: hypothetical protein C0598_12685 [Marinilabiliales bacterium]|nr:MAG: hypothetical protein C0598_12685 [Marinilabiliales bacterium]